MIPPRWQEGKLFAASHKDLSLPPVTDIAVDESVRIYWTQYFVAEIQLTRESIDVSPLKTHDCIEWDLLALNQLFKDRSRIGLIQYVVGCALPRIGHYSCVKDLRVASINSPGVMLDISRLAFAKNTRGVA